MHGRPDDDLRERSVTIDARGWTLSGSLFDPGGSGADGPAVLLSAAAMVPQGYYARFARFLVRNGARAVLTYDYRGVGQSAGDRNRWHELRMKDWAVLDFPAALAFLEEIAGPGPVVGMGHSYGGQALGLSGVADRFERYATVATMSGHWRLLDTPKRIFLLTQVFGPAVARLLGQLPKAISPGEAMPGAVFLDWSRWIASPDYWFDDDSVPETSRFAAVRTPYLSVRPSDDVWATERAVAAFMRHYTANDLRHLVLDPGESGTIGHLGFFRQAHCASHWRPVVRYLLTGQWPEGAVAQASARTPAS